MIARVWKCTAVGDNVEQYVEHFNQSVLPEVRKIRGYRGAYLLKRELNDVVEITAISFWDNLDVIRAFAGDAVETAVVAPAAQAVLRTFDTTVTHHEVVLDLTQTGR